jgi:hypothetical protein
MKTVTSDNFVEPQMIEGKVVKHAQDRPFWLFYAGLRSLNYWMAILFLTSYLSG